MKLQNNSSDEQQCYLTIKLTFPAALRPVTISFPATGHKDQQGQEKGISLCFHVYCIRDLMILNVQLVAIKIVPKVRK